MGLAFFGLTSKSAAQYRVNVFDSIHEIVFHGKGGYTWETVYNMPIWLRKYTFIKIQEFYEKKNNAQKDMQSASKNSKTLVNSSGEVNKTEFKAASKPYNKSTYK